MADELAGIAIEVLLDLLEDLVDEEVITQELADELASEEFTTELTNSINSSIAEGNAEGEVTSATYDTLQNINQEVADAWAEGMEEQGYDVEGTNEEVEQQEFEDTDPESNPDKGETDTNACTETPEGVLCETQKTNKILSFFKWLGSTLGVGVIVGGVVFAITQVIGGIARFICWLINRIRCNNPPQGQTTDQCIDEACDSSLCTVTKGLIQNIRTYFNFIMPIVLLLTIAGTVYLRSSAILIIGLIIAAIVLVLNGVLGNMVATILCNFGATACLLTGNKINC